MTSMSAQDALWLTMDQPTNLMVIDGLMLLDGPVTVGQVRSAMRSAVQRFPVFAQRPVRDGLGWAWEPDPGFSLTRHVVRVRAGAPRDIEELEDWLGQQRSVPLPHDRPLWQTHVISPVRLADGTSGSAVVTRFHHAMADGVRATQVMLGLCEAEDVPVPLVARQPPGGPANPVAAVAEGTVEMVRVTAALGMRLALNVPRVGDLIDAVRGAVAEAEHGITVIRHPDRLLDALEVLGAEEHRPINDAAAVTKLLLTDSGEASWSGPPSARKVVAWSAPIPLADVKAVGRRHGATVNDVLLAAIAGSMRDYLTARGESLDEVVWMVPVNLEPFSPDLPEQLGNHFALVMLPMPLHHESWRDRLAAVHQRMGRIKHSDEALLTFGIQHAVSVAPRALARFMTRFFANKAVGVLTNVPGPTQRLTFGGVGLRQFIGFAPCSGDQSMTATIVSYDGTVTVGFATDFRRVPQPSELVDGVVRQIDAMAGR